ncbi:hypothetical protein RND81_03G223100 [Saponaria officinalis]|uniref:Uncharacterized protein n=1 Tax=Saponaria officinalis TaxID=3572 RepID=A0AAW1MBI4_SAPOF
MADKEAKDLLKDLEWKNMGNEAHTTGAATNTSENGQPTVKKRPPRRIRQIPECYFLPRRSLPSAIAFYGSFIVAGVGAGMLAEVWMNKKIKEDGGGVVWEFGK